MTLRAQATLTAQTTRASMASGKRGAASVHLTGLSATPLQPVQPEVVLRYGLNTPNTVFVSYVIGHHDIRGGDGFVAGGREYTVRSVAPWFSPNGSTPDHTELIVEEVRL